METLDAFIDFGKENSVTETPVYLNNIEKEIRKLKMKYNLSSQIYKFLVLLQINIADLTI